MVQTLWMALGITVGFVLIVWAILRVWTGLQLRLFLISRDALGTDQGCISVNTPYQRPRLFRRLFKRSFWNDSVSIVLADHNGTLYSFEFVHNVWKQYSLLPVKLGSGARLNGRPCVEGKPLRLASGMELELANRKYATLITRYEAGQFGLIDGERFLNP